MKVSEKSRVRTIDLLSLLSDDTKEAMREFEKDFPDPREAMKLIIEITRGGSDDVQGN